ncbi:MAG: peptidoglycan-binding protein [Rudaea sp.]|nr:peptidoglycan-binding protein [Rudaea sp.]
MLITKTPRVSTALLALAAGSTLLLAGCASQMTVGGGSNPVSGSAGGASSKNAAPQLEHCAKPLGTLAVEENTQDQWYIIPTTQYHLPATTPLIRLMIQQSNCFVVVDRGRGLNQMMQERDLAASGELRSRSNLGKGQIVAADYVVTPTIQFSQQTGEVGASLGSAIGGRAGGLLGALAGSMKSSEASTTLMLTDTRSGVQVAASQGSAKNTDFGFGALGIGSTVAGGAGAYNSTPQGKVIAAAFLDSYNQMVKSVREYAPQRVEGGLGTGGQLGVDGATKADPGMSLADAQRKLAALGLYTSKVDGLPGPGTSAAISKFQKIKGLPVTGQLDTPTAAALQN